MSAPALRVLIVDDEPLARARLAPLVGDCPAARCVVVGQCAHVREASDWFESHAADVVLLDIQMPGPPGTALAAQLQRLAQPPAVVFVTAHSEHALAAFDLDAADYLPSRWRASACSLPSRAPRGACRPRATAPPPCRCWWSANAGAWCAFRSRRCCT